MKKKHKIALTILVFTTVLAFVLFNLDYKESVLNNAVQFMNANSAAENPVDAPTDN